MRRASAAVGDVLVRLSVRGLQTAGDDGRRPASEMRRAVTGGVRRQTDKYNFSSYAAAAAGGARKVRRAAAVVGGRWLLASGGGRR
jgi:hypothetical protein